VKSALDRRPRGHPGRHVRRVTRFSACPHRPGSNRSLAMPACTCSGAWCPASRPRCGSRVRAPADEAGDLAVDLASFC